MIRRWSRVNILNFNNEPEHLFFFKYLFRFFKKSTIFKKLNIYSTKYNRKSFGNLKHKYTGLILQQIFNFWVCDTMRLKKLSKTLYLFFSSTPILIADASHFTTKKNKFSSASLEYHSYYLPKRYFTRYLIKTGLFFNWKLFYFSYFLKPYTSFEIYTTPLLFSDDSVYYPFHLLMPNTANSNELYFALTDLFLNQTLTYITEYYKLLLILWIKQLLNNK